MDGGMGATAGSEVAELRLERIAEHVGTTFGPTGWEVVNQERIDLFARASGDTHWIHTDPKRAARETPFGRTLAHGFFTLSQIAPRLHQVITVPDAASWLNYGLDSVRFPAPVPEGARIRYRFRLEGAVPRGAGIVLRFSCETEIEGGAKPAMTATFLAMAFPATDASAQSSSR
jgi:acyl dehydratase